MKIKRKFIHFNFNKFNIKINLKQMLFLVMFLVLAMSTAYSAFGTKLRATNVVAKVRKVEYIRVTNVVADSSVDGGISTYEEYNTNSLIAGVLLPTATSTVTYKVSITNFGNVELGISSITGLPSNLAYTLKDYSIQKKLCNEAGECKLGATKEFYITIRYKNSSSFDSSNVAFDIKVDFNFKKFYSVTYGSGAQSKFSSATTEVMEGSSLSLVASGGTAPSNYIVKMGNKYLDRDTGNASENYYFTPSGAPVLILPPATGDIEIDTICKPITDSSLLTNGNLPSGNFTPGDEYICNVDGTNEYHFYVLSTDNNNVNLIMSHSVNMVGIAATDSSGATAYLKKSDGSSIAEGPITAFNFLSTATSYWITPRMTMSHIYSDAGAGGFYTTTTSNTNTLQHMYNGTFNATYTNLRVRMPYEKEIESAGCSTAIAICPWLIGNIYGVGYWTIPSTTTTVKIITSSGITPSNNFGGITNSVIVSARPVITLTKSDF